ncbi:hypothetical protein P8625_04125 [Tenacibaculum tangerinum]|uniref:CPBP family intramembrane metalloprotease n=1 Tax=Tenacibaculum tangerinum TaxID=3038772 RepID=A0ABY8L4P6_9FLAO|nr:hypothetical protein [Tenacibaculum tangerinum]WGH76360.1 hypothetical protein P8625_04125 [Tenacibaculum tangerinum]
MKQLFRTNFKILMLYAIKVVIAGIIIGLLHEYQLLLVVILTARIIYRIYNFKKHKVDNINIIITGMLITGVIGVTIEYFGTKYGYWEYHDINSQLPHYLLLVWMLAFSFMYNLERKVFIASESVTRKQKLYLVLFAVIVYPSLGEIASINLGVWTYYFPYKFFGITPHTIVAIAFVHMVINYAMGQYLKKKNIKDIVLNP